MSSRNIEDTGLRSQESKGVGRHYGLRFWPLVFGCLVFVSGCRMDMQDQPKYKTFSKGSIRMPVAGTVPRGYLKQDKHLYTGKKDQPGKGATAVTTTQIPMLVQQNSTATASPPAAMYPDVVETFPFPVTNEVVKRGQERYNIFCGMCHGPTGFGDGMIVRRGFKRPPSFHTDQLRQAPVGHFFDVMTNGWGAMPSYAAMVPVTDRWAIVSYIRALQLSQNPQGAVTPNNAVAQPTPRAAQNVESRGR